MAKKKTKKKKGKGKKKRARAPKSKEYFKGPKKKSKHNTGVLDFSKGDWTSVA